MSDQDDFKRRLRGPGKPASPVASYVAAAAVSVVGIVSVLGAKSRPIYLSGWLIVGFCLAWAFRTYWLDRR